MYDFISEERKSKALSMILNWLELVHLCIDMPGLGLGLDSLVWVVLLVLCIVRLVEGGSQNVTSAQGFNSESLNNTDSLLQEGNKTEFNGLPAEVVLGQLDNRNLSTSGSRGVLHLHTALMLWNVLPTLSWGCRAFSEGFV